MLTGQDSYRRNKIDSVDQLMKDKSDDKIITSWEREEKTGRIIQSTIVLIEEINKNIFCFFPSLL